MSTSSPPHSCSSHPASPDHLADLLVCSAAGEQRAFIALYDQVAPRVFGLVLRLVRDRHQSEEVTQEVMLEVWERAPGFDASRGSGITWVLTTAHRRAVDRIRASDASRRRDHAHVLRNAVVAFDDTADAALASSEAARVHAAMARLTVLQEQAVSLAYFGGHTHTEVAKILQIPLSTAKTRIRDGLIRLRDDLVVVPA